MRRRPSERTLRRWLNTGRPRRIGRLIDTEPAVAARLEGLTTLSSIDLMALDDVVTPAPEFETRVLVGVQERHDSQGAASTVVDLLGLGYHVGRALLEPPAVAGDDAPS